MNRAQRFFLSAYLSLKAVALRMLYFKTEQALLSGKFRPVNSSPSVIFFTVHKAGSSLLSLRLSRIFAKNNFTIADLSSFFAKTDNEGRHRFFADEKRRRNVFGATGVFYSVFRYPFTVPFFEKHKILLALRDPRDVLVSHYFSTRFSHPVQNMDFAEQKTKAQHMDIDSYVLSISPDFEQRYSEYMNWSAKPNVLFLRYEDMITDPVAFEEKVRGFTGMSIAKGELVSADDFVVDKEDPTQHKRYVKAGDHVRKLKPETIAELNRRFAGAMKQFGYT
jgi:hypothetical protein